MHLGNRTAASGHILRERIHKCIAHIAVTGHNAAQLFAHTGECVKLHKGVRVK